MIDDTVEARAQVPDKFKAAHFTKLPGGEGASAFVERLQALLGSRA